VAIQSEHFRHRLVLDHERVAHALDAALSPRVMAGSDSGHGSGSGSSAGSGSTAGSGSSSGSGSSGSSGAGHGPPGGRPKRRRGSGS
jgi:hypothetical protein